MPRKVLRRPIILAGLGLALAMAVAAPYGYRRWQMGGERASPLPAPMRAEQRQRLSGAVNDPAAGAPHVRLEELARPRPNPAPEQRNPFRFDERANPRPAAGLGSLHGSVPPLPLSPASPAITGSPPSPPIPLKFIGLVEGATRAGKVAVLSDGRFVYYGREGDIIDGRYRVVRIGVESVVLEHLDGRGRQAIRLSGS